MFGGNTDFSGKDFSQDSLSTSSSWCTELLLSDWQHRHHEPRIRAQSLAGTRSLHLPLRPTPPTHTRRQPLLSRSDREPVPMIKSGVPFLSCIMFMFHSPHAPPRFPQPDLVSFQCFKLVSLTAYFETLNMNRIRNKLHFVFACSWLKQLGRN